jgi:hypothetical protein
VEQRDLHPDPGPVAKFGKTEGPRSVFPLSNLSGRVILPGMAKETNMRTLAFALALILGQTALSGRARATEPNT